MKEFNNTRQYTIKLAIGSFKNIFCVNALMGLNWRVFVFDFCAALFCV